MSDRAAQIQEYQSTLADMKKAKQKALEASKSASTQWLKDTAKDLADQFEKQIKQTETFLDTATSIIDLVDAVGKGDAKAVAGASIDLFLARYATWEGPVAGTKIQKIKIGPFFGFLSGAISYYASLRGVLKARRKGLGIEASGSLKGSAQVGIGLSLGFYVPIVGDVSIEGGIQGGPTLEGAASLVLATKGSDLEAVMNSATLDIGMVANLYLDLPEAIPDFVIAYIPTLIRSLKARENRLLYKLGTVDILQVTTPMYIMSFNVEKGSFSNLRAIGGYNIQLQPWVQRKIKEIKEAIYQAANEFVDSLNPLNWDLNPFD